jgi:hypothetical protein
LCGGAALNGFELLTVFTDDGVVVFIKGIDQLVGVFPPLAVYFYARGEGEVLVKLEFVPQSYFECSYDLGSSVV